MRGSVRRSGFPGGHDAVAHRGARGRRSRRSGRAGLRRRARGRRCGGRSGRSRRGRSGRGRRRGGARGRSRRGGRRGRRRHRRVGRLRLVASCKHQSGRHQRRDREGTRRRPGSVAEGTVDTGADVTPTGGAGNEAAHAPRTPQTGAAGYIRFLVCPSTAPRTGNRQGSDPPISIGKRYRSSGSPRAALRRPRPRAALRSETTRSRPPRRRPS